jgi:hypothetical protein
MALRLWIQCLYVGLCIIVFFAGTADAQQKVDDSFRPRSKAPGVLLSFQGGTVGENFAAAFGKVYENPVDLPVETYVTTKDDTICGILDTRRFPPPCAGYFPLLDRLNSKLKPVSRAVLKQGIPLIIPNLNVRRYRATRVFSKQTDGPKEGADLVKNWPHLQAQRIEFKNFPDTYAIRYNAYEFVVPTADDDAAASLYRRLVALRSPNVLVDLLLIKPPATRFYSAGNAEEVRKFCEKDTIGNKQYRYRDLADGEKDALSSMEEGLTTAGAGSPPPRRKPESVDVYVIDTVLHKLPNLTQSQSGASSWHCVWQDTFKQYLHHATHLAGLIAGKVPPFEGVAPNAQIKSFEWWKPHPNDPDIGEPGRPDRAQALAGEFFRALQQADNRPIFLAALQFEKYDAKSLDPEGLLPNANVRFGRVLERAIQTNRPLLIAAAGQSDHNKPPSKINAYSPRSPQNLGDLPNVVVVTACTDCRRESVKLLEEAFIPYPEGANRRFVHVAAPGGTPIAGWFDEKSLGATAGTSQAAAYVAGLVASMIGYFPRVYNKDPSIIKTRLQVTSRPVAPGPDGVPNPEAEKMAAGVVDPILALLDPTKHWAKEGSWKEVKIKNWIDSVTKSTIDSVSMTDLDSRDYNLRSSALLRIVKTREDAWTVYYDRQVRENGQPGDVGRFDRIHQFGRAAVVLCGDSEPKLLDKFDDLIISVSGVATNECS